MAEVAQQAPMPLATNMCVVAFDHLAPAVAKESVRVVLSDHHYWGGLQRSRLLAGICDTFDLGLSMHSNSHLGISLAAMVHLAGATPNLTYACDTHWPWKTEEIVKPGALEFVDGSVPVPTTPGLGCRDRRRRAGRAARAVRALRYPRPRRHQLHEEHRSRIRGDQPALVAPRYPGPASNSTPGLYFCGDHDPDADLGGVQPRRENASRTR